MAQMNGVRQIEAADLAGAKGVVRAILHDGDVVTWNALLADDITLSVRLGAVGIHQIGGVVAVDGNLRVFGREDAKLILQIIYPDLMSGLSVTSEIVSGYDIALVGDWAVRSMGKVIEHLSVRIILFMTLNDENRVEKMTIAALYPNP